MSSETASVAGPRLAIRDLEVWYGPAQAVFGVSLEVSAGEVVAILGRNGAGKTSSILGILGLGIRRRGTIVLDGADVSSMPLYKLARRGMSWVPDSRRLFPTLSVRDNLRVARGRATGDAQLTDDEIVDLFPLIGPIMKRQAGVLSGGEQQIVAIARVVVRKPRTVLVDEPSEGLAPVIVDRVAAAMTAMKKELGQSVILAEADPEFVGEVADRVVVLSVGRQVHSGTARDFLADEELKKRYLAF